MGSFTKVAGGNVSPCRFVKLDASNDGKCLQCGAGEQIYGISQVGTRYVPWTPLDDGFAAIAGENLMIYGPGSKDVLLEIATTVHPGDRLKSDVNGKGTPTTSANDEIGAIASVAGSSGDLILVQPVFPARY